jgi:bifunctional non-homologous end joining protein LigD
MGLEGIVSKRLGSRYRSGRTRDWLKFKNPDSPAVKRGLRKIGADDGKGRIEVAEHRRGRPNYQSKGGKRHLETFCLFAKVTTRCLLERPRVGGPPNRVVQGEG